MSDPKSIGPGCDYTVGIHERGTWEGWPMPCGAYPASLHRDSRRADDLRCPRHMPERLEVAE